MKTVTNEIEMLQQILLENAIDPHNPLTSIRILAKYLHQYGCDKPKIEATLQQYMDSHRESLRLDPLVWGRRLTSAVNYTVKHSPKLIYIDHVTVTETELQRISALNNDNREKLAFSYLVHSKINNKKYNNELYDVYTPTSDIIKEAECNKPVRPPSGKRTLARAVRKENPLLAISDLVQAGYLEQTRSIGKNTKKTVLFADEHSPAVFRIDDFNHYMNYYLEWRYKAVARCPACNDWVRTTTGRTKYCLACRKEKEKQAKRESWHRNKANYKD
ncbi:hypothetical protein [Paenibacillus sp. GCM10027626]|uniref:hypothetical protein n=1 Tax=Paenibacillus sp. GCM10027626 TaxID=3273411 RepID=UPI00364059AF